MQVFVYTCQRKIRKDKPETEGIDYLQGGREWGKKKKTWEEGSWAEEEMAFECIYLYSSDSENHSNISFVIPKE